MTPLVLSATGGMAKEVTVFFLIRDWPPAWVQNGTSRTVLQCPGYDADLPSLSSKISNPMHQGAHSSIGHATKSLNAHLDLVISEANFI